MQGFVARVALPAATSAGCPFELPVSALAVQGLRQCFTESYTVNVYSVGTETVR